MTESSEADKERLQAEVRQLQTQLTELKARLRELEFEQVKSAPVPTIQERLNSSNGSNIPDSPLEEIQEKYVHKPRQKPVEEKKALSVKPNTLNISNETLPSISAEIETEASSEHGAGPQAKAKGEGHMMAAEVETDSSGDSWPDIGSQPELSEAISSGKIGELDSTLEKTLPRGNDEVDGSDTHQPFHVTELPVTITEDSNAAAKVSPRAAAQNVCQEQNLLELLTGSGELDESGELDSDEEDEGEEEEPPAANSKTEPVMTRDKTLKIFKQLKKAKQRSKKCLAPTPKMSKEPKIPSTAENNNAETRKQRTNSFEKSSTEMEENDVDVDHIKEDIIAKSGMDANQPNNNLVLAIP